jgi:hypothetical protein
MNKKSLEKLPEKSLADKMNEELLILTHLAETQRKFPEQFTKEDILRALGLKLKTHA